MLSKTLSGKANLDKCVVGHFDGLQILRPSGVILLGFAPEEGHRTPIPYSLMSLIGGTIRDPVEPVGWVRFHIDPQREDRSGLWDLHQTRNRRVGWRA